MGKQVKVAEFEKANPTTSCVHWTATVDMGDGSFKDYTIDVTDSIHDSPDDIDNLIHLWLKSQLKFNADKTKLKNKNIFEVTT